VCPVLTALFQKRHAPTGESQKEKKRNIQSLENVIYEEKMEERKFFSPEMTSWWRNEIRMFII